jgi:hypothetical protein
MIVVAAIAWAVIATGLGLAAVTLSEYQRRWKKYWYVEATDCLNKWGVEVDRRIDTEDRLRKIEQQRHLSAKKARAAQIEQRRANVLETAKRLEAGE